MSTHEPGAEDATDAFIDGDRTLVRGTAQARVIALWIMGFGGTVPVGVLVAGPIARATSITFIVLDGAVVAIALAFYADLVAVGAPD